MLNKIIMGSLLAVIAANNFTANALTLVNNGKANATIIISENAPYKNKLAANELQHFIEKISGAKLKIVSDKQKVTGQKILVGQSRYTKALKVNIPSGFSFENIKEGFIIKTIKDSLILAGNDDGPSAPVKKNRKRPYRLGGGYKGSLFAVYAFLERLGCHWYFPGDFGEVCPEMKTIIADNLDIKEKPSFMFRGYWNKRHIPAAVNADDAFFNRNRFLSYSSGFANARDGSIRKCIPVKKYFKSHPEYFGLNKDRKTRNKHVLCMSNPDVINLVIESARNHFKKHPESNYYGVAPADGEPACWCEKCLSMNGQIKVEGAWAKGDIPCISGSYYNLIFKLGKAMEKEFPGKIISASIYAGRILPPPENYKFPKNVGGHLALLEYSLMRPIDDPDNWESVHIRTFIETWEKRIDKLIYRPYNPSFMVHCGLPLPMPRNAISNVKFLKRRKQKLMGFRWEGWQSWNTSYLDYYVYGRLLWNADLDGEKLLNDFYQTFYGPAAKSIKAFYDALENRIVTAPFNTHEEELIPEIYPYTFVKGLMKHIDAAEKAVRNASPAFKKRVKMARITADHLLAYSEMRDVAERNYDYKRAAELAKRMYELEDQMMAICPNFYFPDHRRYDQRKSYGLYGANFSSVGKRKQYENIQKLIDGTTGSLVAKSPKYWSFKQDDLSLGMPAQWFTKDTDVSKWKKLEIGRCWEVQGYYANRKALMPWLGTAWYACDIEVPEKFKDKPMAIFVGGINNEAWVWINGKLINYQPFHTWWMRPAYTWTKTIKSGIIKPGKNRITVKVIAGDRFGFGGIFRNIFLYSPNNK